MFRRLASWTSLCAWLLISCGPPPPDPAKLPPEQYRGYDKLTEDYKLLVSEAPWISHWEGEDTYVFWSDLSKYSDTRVGQCTAYSGVNIIELDYMRLRPSYRLSTLAHEIGHAMGLEHNETDPESVMYPSSTYLDAKAAAASLKKECNGRCKKMAIHFGRPQYSY